MTPTSVGVREDCANTRESDTRHNGQAFDTRLFSRYRRVYGARSIIINR